MNENEIKVILKKHKEWLDSNEDKGERADLQWANLQGANLEGMNLEGANLRGANLRDADLYNANLQGANLQGANLEGACLRGANLRGANLRYADLWNADLDFSCLPLWCGSLEVKIDAKIAAQLMYHTMSAIQSVKSDADVAAVLANVDCIRLANRFHRASECGMIGKKKEEA